MSLRTTKTKFIFEIGFITVVAAGIRLLFLGILPPGGANAYWIRFPSATAGIASIVLLMSLVYKHTADKKLSLISGVVLTLMPWHIELSRVYSPAMLGLTVLLGGAVIFTYFRSKAIRFISLAGTIGFFYLVYPSFWLFQSISHLPTVPEYLGNLYKLISIEFLFYKNDSFWRGGLRGIGTMLPSFLPIFLLGLVTAVSKWKKSALVWLVGFLVIMFIAGAHPLFPEQQEYFIISPYLALILGYGTIKLLEYFNKSDLIIKTAILAYSMIIVYEHLWFIHIYTTHYSQQIENEIPYEKRDF